MVRLRRRADGIAAPSQSRLLWFALCCAALAAGEVYALFVQTHGAPRATLGKPRFLAGEIAETRTISQTMRLDAVGFRGVTISAAPFHRQATGDVVFALAEVAADGDRPLYRFVRRAADVVRRGSYEVSFPPIEASRGRVYRLDVRMPATMSGGGIGLWATNAERYPGGALFIDGREHWGDLAFATEAVASTAFRQLEYALRDKPAWLRSRVLLGGAFALYNWALATFLYYMVFADEGEWQS